MEKRDFLQIWGALQAYKDNVQHKAMDAAARGDETGRQLSASYLKTVAEITDMQRKIDREIAAIEGGDTNA